MSDEKSNLHPRNLHRKSYDFDELIATVPELKHYVFKNKYDRQSINFSIAKAVKLLNKALLQKYYNVLAWDIPDSNLCPPIPGRADYIHYIADLLGESFGEVPQGLSVIGLDIGVGASLIYPLIAHQSYSWRMIGSDISQESLDNSTRIIAANKGLSKAISLKHQSNSEFIFRNIIQPEDHLSFTMCNPPFHSSAEAATKGNLRKTKNLHSSKASQANLNFGGQNNELWCKGGEVAFVAKLIKESKHYSTQVLWFTCLISKKDNLPVLLDLLKESKVIDIKVVEMAQGQKISRFLAWTFVPKASHKTWLKS